MNNSFNIQNTGFLPDCLGFFRINARCWGHPAWAREPLRFGYPISPRVRFGSMNRCRMWKRSDQVTPEFQSLGFASKPSADLDLNLLYNLRLGTYFKFARKNDFLQPRTAHWWALLRIVPSLLACWENCCVILSKEQGDFDRGTEWNICLNKNVKIFHHIYHLISLRNFDVVFLHQNRKLVV